VLTSITYTATLDMGRETVEFVSLLLGVERRRRRTRKNTRALSPFKQAVLIIRWFLDGTRIGQLACDNRISRRTADRYIEEGVGVLTATAPTLEQALVAAQQAGLTHLNLDGTVIETDRCRVPGPHGYDLWWSGKHKHHGGNIQVLSAPDGFPIWTSPVRPGREHDITAARTHQILDRLEESASQGLVTLADLGYEDAPAGIRLPRKKPLGGTLTDEQIQYNYVHRALRALAERANAQLKMRFKALRNISKCPWKIGDIVAAALVLFHHENQRTV
jgi:DDE superfamily endonuclease